jgi:hypothetical protein
MKWKKLKKLLLSIVLIDETKFIKGENQRSRNGRKIFSNPSANNQQRINFLNLPYSGKVGEKIEFPVTTSNFATDTLIFNWDFGDGATTTTNSPFATHA